MKVADLKRFIECLPDDMDIFVGCQGYSNYNFEEDKPYEDSETMIIFSNGSLFLTDSCMIDGRF